MGKYKTRVRLYAAWNYQREIDDLNEMSEKGWQLVKGGLFSSRFKKDDSIRYRYQLDYQSKIDDLPRYVDSFREFGWEHISSTFNGWHYLRKPYDPSLLEEEYEIFTDRESLKEMNSRWVKLAVGITIFVAIALVLQLALMILKPTLQTLFMLIAYLVMVAGFARGIAVMKNPDSNKRRKFDRFFIIAFLVLAIGSLIGSNVLLWMRADSASKMTAEDMEPIPAAAEEALLWNTIEVNYRDNYFIDTEINADSPVTVTLINEKGEMVYTVTDDEIREDNARRYLEKGEYKVYLSDFAGGTLEVYFNLD